LAQTLPSVTLPKPARQLATRSSPAQTLQRFHPEPDDALPPKDDIARVRERLLDAVPEEIYRHFDLYLYVSKADHGPWAQRMYVFAKDEVAPDASLRLLHAWPVSTGREAMERNIRGQRSETMTPAGLFELDPERMFVRYTSHEWGEAMPYSMFFN